MRSTCSIKNYTRHKVPRVLFEKVVDYLLPGWDVSIVFVGDKRARHLNTTLRNKTYVPSVLSYTIGKKSGEVFLCPNKATRDAKKFSQTPSEHLLFLCIHALLHLKGRAHGSTMEKEEWRVFKHFRSSH